MSYHTKYGDRICIDGYLWELTYSEMGPPDSRQNTGIQCPECNKENNTMRISSAFPSDYLKAADLQGRPVTVIMSRVTMQDMNGDPKPILYFEGKEKGLVLNKTNANKISEIFGDDTDNWAGQEIILYEAMVEFQGKTVPAIRVRLAPRKPNRQNQAPPAPPPPQDDFPEEDIPF